jgi:hypothetical protein
MPSTPVPFSLPSDALIYTDEVITRCMDFLYCGIWAGIHPSRLRKWLNNFNTDEEKYFAACVLDSLVYRSEQQTVSLLRQLLQRTLPDLTRLDPTPLGAMEDWQGILKIDPGAADPGVRLVAAVQRTDPPTKSAYVILRLLKRHLGINENWVISPWAVAESLRAGIQVFVFIDDFLGTGQQFIDIATAEGLASCMRSAYAAYVPLAGHTRGIANLTTAFPELRVQPVETLDDDFSLFAPSSQAFDDGMNTPDGAEAFYDALLDSKGLKLIGADRKGYGGLGLAYAFSHAVPDNSLPILWYATLPGWEPLFDR